MNTFPETLYSSRPFRLASQSHHFCSPWPPACFSSSFSIEHLPTYDCSTANNLRRTYPNQAVVVETVYGIMILTFDPRGAPGEFFHMLLSMSSGPAPRPSCRDRL